MGYGTGATLKASTDAYNEGLVRNEALKRSEAERDLAGRRDQRADEQMGMQREQMGMQRDLFQRQTRLLNDQEERAKFEREINRGMATAVATSGQVFQPLVDSYNKLMPDGGRINSMTRNPDGTFDFEYDRNGVRVPATGRSLDEVMSFFLSMSNPEGFLNTQRDITANAAIAAQAERLERLKADLRRQPTPAQYTSAYKIFSDVYDKSFTLSDGMGGPSQAAPGAPARAQWVNEQMAAAGFTASGGAGGVIPPGGDNEERDKAKGALLDAFSSMPRLREYLREGGLPVEDLMETVGGGARLAELERGMLDGGPELEKHIRAMAGRVGIADITDEEVAEIAGNRQPVKSGPLNPDPGKLGQAWQNISNEFGVLREHDVPSLAQVGLWGLQALNNAGPAMSPSRDATGRVGPRPPGAEAQIIAPNEQLLPPGAVPPQGVVPTPAQTSVTQAGQQDYYPLHYGR